MTSTLRVRVLGASAGGGLPQWNCACPNCLLARAGDARITPRTQDALALSANGRGWVLVNASPDVLRQIEAFPALHPRTPRDSPIAAVALTNGDLDHVAGLLSLRESQPLVLLATESVRAGLVDRNAMLRTLQRFEGHTTWRRFELGKELVVDQAGLGVTALAAPGKLPVHLMGLIEPSPEDNVALRIRALDTGRTCVVATAIGALEGAGEIIAGADLVLFDGTFWTEDELPRLGLGKGRARDMAHVPIGGDEGSLAWFARADGRSPALPVPGRNQATSRRVYTHINNTNPILVAGSPEREAVERAGWEVAHDGMEIAL